MRLFLLAFIAAFSLGCGGSDLPELCTVSGKVTKDGKPVSGVYVTFTPKSSGRPSSGRTDAEGDYTLMYNIDTEGAIVGMHTVTVASGSDDEDYEEADPNSPDAEQQETINYKVDIEVKSGSNTMNIPI